MSLQRQVADLDDIIFRLIMDDSDIEIKHLKCILIKWKNLK